MLSWFALPRFAFLSSAGLVGACFVLVGVAEAGDSVVQWPGKTGPFANGNAPIDWSGSLPIEWDLVEGRHVAWTTPLELPGHSTPVVGDGKIWFTSASDDGKEQYVDCVDAATGKVLHHRLLFENPDPEPLGNPVNNYAAPTPALEAEALYVHFGTYGTARIDPTTAEVVWQRRDINVRHFRGPGSSPIIVGDLLILTFDGIDRQFLIGLDKETGNTVWQTFRSTDYGDLDAAGVPLREGDLRKSYSTPAVVQVAGRSQVISVGSKAAFGYDALTGEEIWTVTHDDYNAAAQPLVFGETVILHTGSRGANLLAVRLDETTRGDVTESHVVWDRPQGNSRLAFPILVGDRVVFVTDAGVATAVDARNGEELWSRRIGGNFIASPLAVGNRVYFFNSDGKALVAEVDDEGMRVLAENSIDDGLTASPAAAASGLILRSKANLRKLTGG